MTNDINRRKQNPKVNYLEYVDASYAYKRVDVVQDATNHVVGRIFVTCDAYIGISFRDSADQPVAGLLIPKTALMKVRRFKRHKNLLSETKIGADISVTWKDIIHFGAGQIPKNLPTAYSEGIFVGVKNETLIIDKPETILFYANQEPRNHPEKKASRYFIPLRLITNISFYGK